MGLERKRFLFFSNVPILRSQRLIISLGLVTKHLHYGSRTAATASRSLSIARSGRALTGIKLPRRAPALRSSLAARFAIRAGLRPVLVSHTGERNRAATVAGSRTEFGRFSWSSRTRIFERPIARPQTKLRGLGRNQFVSNVGLFWQNGHDEGMEINHQSPKEGHCHGANSFRRALTVTMYADALAISHAAKLSGDNEASGIYGKKAARSKRKCSSPLGSEAEFFFHPQCRCATRRTRIGNIVKADTLTYESGKSPEIRMGAKNRFVPCNLSCRTPATNEPGRI